MQEETSPRGRLNLADLVSILKGAAINLSGTVLVSVGLFLGSLAVDTPVNWAVLLFALASNVGATLVNIGRKLIQGPSQA